MWMTGNQSNRQGVVAVVVVVGLMALMGAAALAIDVSRLIVAAQRAQNIADTAALAGACELPYDQDARDAAVSIVATNNAEGCGLETQCDISDTVYYPPTETVPNYAVLGPWACALRVSTHVPVEYSFARLVGIEGAIATRSALVVRAPVGGIPICTMWIAHETPLAYGQQQQMLMAGGPHYAGIPGSFGFLQSPVGCTATSFDLLRGYNLTPEEVATSLVGVEETVYADPGVDVGSFTKALKQHQGTARLERGTSGKWASDTFENYHNDNPRIMLVPLVSYLGGTGSNAAFRIEKFGAFWLEEVQGGQKTILGRFLHYDMPGGEPDPSLIKHHGIFATKLVR
jgi:hypothetical protein